jgi:hypothetical protein
MREMRNIYRELEEKKGLGKPRRRWEEWIRMHLEETGGEDVDSFHLAQDREQ